ncbi:MBL fold metallo-hydrolase, partial [bacterium]|nr:MBL fold metallo-hydrolase [bacterium]
MRILPFGCYGSDLGPKKSLSISFSPSILLDAGAILGTLSLDDILKLRHIVISHAHFDHIKELPMLADLLLIHARQTITIHCTKTVGEQLKHYIFNNIIWPDFTKIPKAKPTIVFEYFSFETPFTIDETTFLPIAVNHVVESSGFIISDATATVAWSGDTHRSASLIEHINALPSIDAIFFETSFPNRLQVIADASLHLTP